MGRPHLWTWADEATTLRTLRERDADAFRRYVEVMQTRPRDFAGQPVTSAWRGRFLRLVKRVLTA